MSFRAYKMFTTEATDGRSGRTDGVAVSSTTTYYSSPVAIGVGSQLSLSLHWIPSPTAARAATCVPVKDCRTMRSSATPPPCPKAAE